MSPSAPLPSSEDPPHSSALVSTRVRTLTEALRRAVTDLDASAVGVTRASGGAPKYFTRSALGAQFFEDVCANGLQALQAQTLTKGGVFGTNRVRADSTGPVRGRLIALALSGPHNLPLGILVAVRLIEEEKFGPAESQKLIALAREFEALLLAERASPLRPPAPASRGMWPAETGVVKPAESVTAGRAATPEQPVTTGAAATAAQPITAGVTATPIQPIAAAAAVMPVQATITGSAAMAAQPIATGAAAAPTTNASVEPRAVVPDAPTASVSPEPTKPAEAYVAEIAVASALKTAAIAVAASSSTVRADESAAVEKVGPEKPRADASEAATPVAPGKPDKPTQPQQPAVAPPRTPRSTSLDPNDTVTTLLGWPEFERQIRAEESDDKLPGCVLYGDMDQLHVLNKLAGFATGDRAIAEVGGAMQTAGLPQGSRSCHLSGDRFTVYIPRTTLAQGRRLAEQLSKSVSGLSVTVHGVPTPLSISFGVALIPATDGGLGHALAAAEAACKAAKDRGRGRVEVYQDADQSIVRRNDDVLVADRLRQALEAGRVEVFAQPIVRLNGTHSTANYELLVRLIGDAGTHLSPTWFMSAATRYRMLVELDRAVVGHVLAKLEAQKALLARKNLRFSVNLSGPSIGDPDFLEWLASRIGGVGVPGEWLQFEITETAAVANIASTQAMIRRLQARGVQFALDDFGTGVSSFAYLKFFDVKMLKLDGSFVRDLMSNSRSESLVRGIAQLGRGMNIETVAECVETRDVRDRLTELGIDCAQGFFFGRPKPFDGILATELGIPSLPGGSAEHTIEPAANSPPGTASSGS